MKNKQKIITIVEQMQKYKHGMIMMLFIKLFVKIGTL
jgi:hypothetical protein